MSIINKENKFNASDIDYCFFFQCIKIFFNIYVLFIIGELCYLNLDIIKLICSSNKFINKDTKLEKWSKI